MPRALFYYHFVSNVWTVRPPHVVIIDIEVFVPPWHKGMYYGIQQVNNKSL